MTEHNVATLARENPTSDLTDDFMALNARLRLADADGKSMHDLDHEALESYLRYHVRPRFEDFQDTSSWLQHLFGEGHYDATLLRNHTISDLVPYYEEGRASNHQFGSFFAAYKFYSTYALRDYGNTVLLESYVDRVSTMVLTISAGDLDFARRLREEVLSGRFQFTTPTLMNSGIRHRGESISCFLVRIEDSMESVTRSINSATQLSKRSGGVGFLLSNIRDAGAPLRGVEGQAGGIIPVMRLLEDAFLYAHQLGSREGAGAVYLHAHHPEILDFLDTRKENADSARRIKTLALGIVIPDITFELAKNKKRCSYSRRLTWNERSEFPSQR